MTQILWKIILGGQAHHGRGYISLYFLGSDTKFLLEKWLVQTEILRDTMFQENSLPSH